jgi:sugar phosphate isomerase/epimerase/predicted metal-dependent hydrolase
MTLRIGLSSGAFYPDVATEDVPAAAARLGVHDLELMLQTPGEYDPAFIGRVKAGIDATGTSVHSIHTFQSLHPFVSGYARRTEEARTLFWKAIDGAAALGAKAIVWHGFSDKERQGRGSWDRFFEVVTELAGDCREAGVTLAIENVSWCIVATVRDALTLAARLPELGPPEAIGFTFDPFQAAEAQANPFMILAAMEGRLANVHISDLKEDDRSARHLPPGDGDLPWPALLRAVSAAGYDGPLMMEGPLGPDPAATMARIRAWFAPLNAGLSDPADHCAGSLPPGVLKGIDLFNVGEFYECHEEIEHEWHAERGPIRKLYQGILQIGVGFHHARGGNHRGAVLLLTDGIEKVSAFLPVCRGVDTARLVAESQACLDAIIALGPKNLLSFDWEIIPQVYAASGFSEQGADKI